MRVRTLVGPSMSGGANCLIFVLVWLSVLLASHRVQAKGSCRTSRKCCDGKNADCIVQNAPHNAIVRDLSDEPCYCDHGCLEVGDCCPDFKDYCGVIDCQVSEWSEWSKCDVSCGVGTSIRSREVMRPESNGGIQCPILEDKKTCQASKCSKRHLDKISALRETAMLLPGKYAPHRDNLKYDVRSNLKSYRQREGQQYCVVFEVDKSMKACIREEDTEDLERGNRVCVLCDSKAQHIHLNGRCAGHGADGKRTRFKNILEPRCHGKWTRVELSDECPCKNGADFMFV